MELSEFRKDYQKRSAKASDVSRQLAFAGIAIIWIFKVGENANVKIPEVLIVPLGLFVAALAMDLLHYVVSSVLVRIFFRGQERKGVSGNTDVKAPTYISITTVVFFTAKVSIVIQAYVMLIIFFYDSLYTQLYLYY